MTPQRHHATMPKYPTQTRIRHTNIKDKFRAQYLTSSYRICACSPLTNAQPTQSSAHASHEASQCTQQLQPLPLVEPPESWQPQLSPFCSPLKYKLQVVSKFIPVCRVTQSNKNLIAWRRVVIDKVTVHRLLMKSYRTQRSSVIFTTVCLIYIQRVKVIKSILPCILLLRSISLSSSLSFPYEQVVKRR